MMRGSHNFEDHQRVNLHNHTLKGVFENVRYHKVHLKMKCVLALSDDAPELTVKFIFMILERFV